VTFAFKTGKASKAKRKVSGPRSIKKRRTQAEMSDLRFKLFNIVSEEPPMIVRQAYYQCVARGFVEKTEAQCRAITRQLGKMRNDGTIPYEWITDSTRWMRRPTTYGSVKDCLEQTARLYRRHVWADLDCRVEIWLEKEALAGVLVEVTDPWDVPLMVCRGYPSTSFVHAAGEAITDDGVETFIYYFGDHDPSGRNIAASTEQKLRKFSGGVDVHFQSVAITPEQIAEFSLPTRPTKKSDPRSNGWTGGSIEVDALPPSKLRELTSECIERHIPEGHMDVLEKAESSERDALRIFGDRFSRWDS
jgi:hypothetical protein